MQSSRICRKSMFVWVTVLWAVLGAGAPRTATAQQPSVFYLIGAEEEHTSPNLPNALQYQGVHLYEMDSATHVLRSAALNAYSGMFTGNRKTIVLVEGGDEDKSTLLLVSVPELKVQGRMDIPMSEMPMDIDGDRVPCLDNIFVHPITGFAYFSCPMSRAVVGLLRADPFHHKVVQPHLPVYAGMPPTFLYDSKRQWMYPDPGDAILDANDQSVAKIHIEIPGHPSPLGVSNMALLPDGNLVALCHILLSEDDPFSDAPVVLIYDPVAGKVLRFWTEGLTYSGTVSGRIHGIIYKPGTPIRRYDRIPNVPVPSRDGSRLFGIEGSEFELFSPKTPADSAILWDTKTLQVLRRWTLPESRSSACKQRDLGGTDFANCFALAPDGRGMWYFGKSGKIYRLDDRTGDLIEEVKLPFHFISLIREP